MGGQSGLDILSFVRSSEASHLHCFSIVFFIPLAALLPALRFPAFLFFSSSFHLKVSFWTSCSPGIAMDQSGQAIDSLFKRMCVFCGSSSGKKPIYTEVAEQLGNELVSDSPFLSSLVANEILSFQIATVSFSPGGVSTSKRLYFCVAIELE